MYTFEIAVIGGQGGGPFSHADSKELAQARCWLGAGSNGTRLSKLHVEHWQVLSHNYGTYTCIKDPSKEITTAGVGNVRGKGHDFEIPLDHRVQRVCVTSGGKMWAAGAHCLNFLEIATAPVADGKAVKVSHTGDCHISQPQRKEPGRHGGLPGGGGPAYPCCQVVCIPEGLTLAGIGGRYGDSWDQVRLLVCPWLPEGGVWTPAIHKHLVTPFKQQVRALLLCMHQLRSNGLNMDRNLDVKLASALFDATFMADQPVNAAPQPSLAIAAAAGGVETGADRRSARLQGEAATEAEAAGAETAARSPSSSTAAAAGSDFVGSWMQQHVQQARQASETVVTTSFADSEDYESHSDAGSATASGSGSDYGYSDDSY